MRAPAKISVLLMLMGTAFLLGLMACSIELSAGPGVGLSSVEPAHATNDAPIEIQLQGHGFSNPRSIGFRTSRGIDTEPPAVHLGQHPLSDVRIVDDQTILASIPSGIAPGTYDLALLFEGDTLAILEGAFEVTLHDNLNDAGALNDGGPMEDSGHRLDGSVVVDAGPGMDAGPQLDAALPGDAGDNADGGPVSDGGPAPDASTSADSGTQMDSGNPSDGGSVEDGGAAADGGTDLDAGGVLDAGPYYPFPGSLPAAGWNGGGNEYHLDCPANRVVMGFDIRTGTTWDFGGGGEFVYKVRAQCAQVQVQGMAININPNTTTADAVPAVAISADGPYTHDLDCPAGHVVVGFSGWNGGWVLQGLEIICAPILLATMEPDLSATVTLPLAGRTGSNKAGPIMCPAPDVATGFEGYSGEVLDSFTVRCGPVP